MFSEKWDGRFLELAKHIASWSKDPSTKCGAVIVRPNKTIASIGFNGFPRGISDNQDRYSNPKVKHSLVVHAEVNALLHAQEKLSGFCLYTWPVIPCVRCAVLIAQSGIARVVSQATVETANISREEYESARKVFVEVGISLVELL